MKTIAIFIVTLFISLGCLQKQRNLEKILNSGELRVLTLNTPTTYYENSQGETIGFEHDMIKKFSAWMGVTPRFIVVNSIEELFEGLETGRGDLIAAGISITDERQKSYSFGPSYQRIEQQVICRAHQGPRNVKQLTNRKIVVISGTSYEETLKEYRKKHPDLHWETVSGISNFELYQKLQNGTFDCTLTDSNIASISRRPFPSLEISISLKEEDLGWVMRSEENELQTKVITWFSRHFTSSNRHELIEKYYAHTRQFDSFDTTVFKERIQERLPKYREYFEKAASEYNWPWKLLAAISYQESHWDPQAKSPTGVRGMMMLTQATAKEMGVDDRLDAKQSIMGGARYLAHLKNRIPEFINEQDRLWMTLASYNIGFQHLRNARAVAVWRNLNPNSWSNVRQALPLLTNKEVYRYLPNGYARGGEPVIFVDRIRHYYDILEREL